MKSIKVHLIAMLLILFSVVYAYFCRNTRAEEEPTIVAHANEHIYASISLKTLRRLDRLLDYVCKDGYLKDRTSIDEYRNDICEKENK